MENRTNAIKYLMIEIISQIDNEEFKCIGYSHLFGVAKFAAMLAETRGFDLVEAELASVAGYVHDIAAFSGQGGIRHAEKGAEILKEVLPGLDIFSAEEIGRICTAVSRHSSKQEIHTDFDEVLKDADVLDHYFSDISHISEKDYPRMVRLNEELKLNLEFRRYE